jgi:hypothetical protein
MPKFCSLPFPFFGARKRINEALHIIIILALVSILCYYTLLEVLAPFSFAPWIGVFFHLPEGAGCKAMAVHVLFLLPITPVRVLFVLFLLEKYHTFYLSGAREER